MSELSNWQRSKSAGLDSILVWTGRVGPAGGFYPLGVHFRPEFTPGVVFAPWVLSDIVIIRLASAAARNLTNYQKTHV